MHHKHILAQQKKSQNKDWKCSNVHEQYNELQSFFGNLALNIGYQLINENLEDKKILIVCAGNGYDANFWYNKGAIVTATDLSEEACKKIHERNSHIITKVENAEQLSYKDDSFDYVIVRAGLHHLPRPMIGVYEMLRVAKKGILFMEAQDSWIMRILRKSGLVLDIEPSGNYVYTFTRREIQKLCNSLFLSKPQIRTFFYQYIPFLNNKIYTKMHGNLGLLFYKCILNILNFLFGYWGNNFVCYISKHKKL